MDEGDAEQLRLVSILHYVLGGFLVLAGFFPFIHVWIGLSMLSGEGMGPGGSKPPPEFAQFFVAIAVAAIVGMWTLAALVLFAARSLSKRRNRTFCMVVAGVACLFVPLGTILGVFTLVVLLRPSVKRLFV